ncbi:MAG: hypothetical protein ACR2HV_08885 [Acidimicrobiales bacterium]
MTRRRATPWIALPLFLVALVASSCASSEYRYVAHQSTQTFLKVPKDWTGFDAELLDRAEAKAVEVAGEQAPSFIDLVFNGALQWRVAYDSDPNPQPAHAVSFAVDPVVEVRVRDLTEDERDHVNLASLRNMFFPYDQLKTEAEEENKGNPLEANLPATSAFRPLRETPINTDDGVRGTRLVFELRQGNEFYVIDQTALLDAKAERVHVLLIRAAESEYLSNSPLLNDIATSFTVKQKD